MDKKLTPKQKAFCDFYIQSGNATESAVKAGYSKKTAKVIGSENLTKPAIAQYIDERLKPKEKKRIADADEVMQYFTDVMRGEIKDAFDMDPSLADRSDAAKSIMKRFEATTKVKQKDSLDVEEQKLRIEKARAELESKSKAFGEADKYKGLPATLIAPAFIKVVHMIEEQMFHEYVFPGGRMSTKSSFISLEIIDLMEKNPELNAAIYRQVAGTLKDSVYAQMVWAIQALGLEDEYKCNVSPMEITKKSTGQKIFFRGCDDPYKSKGIKAPTINKEQAIKVKERQLKQYAAAFSISTEELEHLTSDIKVENGYIGILWFEELDQFKGPEAIRTVTQSVIRGGEKTYIFKSFNPPKSANNWANKYIKIPKQNMIVTPSTYLDVPKSWLGKPALEEAEFLKETNPTAYENEYLGVANGTGGNVFDNVVVREITDEEIKRFDNIMNGVDWGWYPDLYSFVRVQYDPAQLRLYIWQEYTCNKQSNRQTADKLIQLGITSNDLITCDSAENKSVGDYKSYGLLARGAEKGPGSREYSYKWLQSLREIVIDNARCPVAVEEFINYEYERDKDGNVISGYPDGNDHVIDSVRYATERIWKRRGQ